MFIKNSLVLLFAILWLGSFAQDTLTVENAINIALQNNYDITISKNDATIAKNNNAFGTAGFLPQLNSDASQSYTINNTYQKRSTGEITNRPDALTNTLSARILLNWTIFDGFSMFINKNKLSDLEQLGETKAKDIIQNTINELIITYYSIVQLQKLVAAIENAIKISNERVSLAQMKSKIGAGSELSYYLALVDLNSDSSQLIQQLITLKNAKADLNKILVQTDSSEFNVSANIPVNTQLNFDSLQTSVFSQNTQLIISKLNQQLAYSNLKLSQSQFYPKLSVYSGYTFSNTKSQAGIFQENRGYGPTIGLTATYNLFNGFNDYRNAKNAIIQFQSSQVAMQQTEQNIQFQLKKLYNEYRAQLNILILEEKNTEVAKKTTSIALERLKTGTMSDIEFRATQQKQIDAEIRLLNAQFMAKLKETQLLTISGRIF